MQLRHLVCLPEWSMHLQINRCVFHGPSACSCGADVGVWDIGKEEKIKMKHERNMDIG